ncbi:hypothetical protein [Geminocystis sp. NIES-3709]|uniref:hypothetical protein n=1 Tax=Geminocystis sp. NIES-3709 TaxID=1617448 RepID=UPI0005FCC894|nr:hypothetical protein [Geminocystis sp. NIES-3709]BAQ63821.1 hypothetical protein GM3709_586 [Geminocystis sp. NIES-3709]
MSLSSTYSSIAIGLTLLLSPVTLIPPFSNSQVLAQNNQVNVLSQGKGTWKVGRKSPISVTSASVTLQTDNKAQITLFLQDNRTVRLDGNFTRQTATQGRINLTNSGAATAQGSILLEYTKNNTIGLLNGQGSLDGQNFRMIFRGDQSSSKPNNTANLNIQQSGEGLFSLQSRPNQNITSVFINVDSNNRARISLLFKNGNSFNFEGRQTSRDAYSIRIQVDRSGMADAIGFFIIELGARNSINNLIGQGTLDGQNFLANFR